MKLVEIINARTVLNGINEKLPFTTAYKIAKFVKDTETAAELFDEKRKAIFEKYAVEKTDDEGNKTKIIPDDDLAAANKEMAELGETELADVHPTFNADDFGAINLTTAQVYALLGVIKN